MKDLENQVCILRSENLELKRDITRIFSLIQATHVEIGPSSSQANERAVTLEEKIENVGFGIEKMGSKIDVFSIQMLELDGKFDVVGTKLGLSSLEMHASSGKGKGGMMDPPAGSNLKQ